MWSSLYGSYIFLICSPMLAQLALYIIASIHGQRNKILERFILSTILIISALFIGSVRHSWRAGYNYPDPDQMMGRYVFYSGPLILLASMIIFFQYKEYLKKYKKKFAVILLLLISFFWLSYGIVYKGWIFLNRPAIISGTSTDNYLMGGLGGYFPVLIMVLCFSISWMIMNDWKYKFELTCLFLAVFYILGDIFMFNKKVLRQQFQPIQVYHLIKAAEELNLFKPDHPELTEVTVKVDPDNVENDESYGRWLFTLEVNGFRDVKFETDERLTGEAQAYRFVQVGDIEFAVDGANEMDYLSCDCEKYEFMGKYYTIQPIRNRQ